MDKIVNLQVEFYEVLNAFPFLKVYLEKIGIPVKNIPEGKSVYEFFKMLNYRNDEISLIVTKINCEINSFLKRESKKIIKNDKFLSDSEIYSDNRESSSFQDLEEE